MKIIGLYRIVKTGEKTYTLKEELPVTLCHFADAQIDMVAHFHEGEDMLCIPLYIRKIITCQLSYI